MTKFINQLKTRLIDHSKRDDGSITVEFVVMLPLLIFWFLGALTFFEAYRANSLVSKVAYTISDITSKYGEQPIVYDSDGNVIDDPRGIYEQDLEELYQIQQRMMPRRVSRGVLRISSICYFEDNDSDDDPTHRVLWSWVGDSGEINADTDELTDDTIPVGIMPIMANQDTVILTELFARWTPVSELGGFMKPLVWTNRVAERPRLMPLGMPYFPDHLDTVCYPRSVPPS